MKRKLNILSGDKALWVIFFLLSGISLVAVYSTIGLSAIDDLNSTPMRIFFKHMAFVVLSYLAIIIISHINYRYFAKLSRWVFYASLVMLLIVMVMHTGRWLVVPHVGRFEPSEIAKVAMAVFLARTVAVNRHTLDEPRTYYMLLIPIAVTCALIVPENLSTGILVFLTGYVMLYFGGVNRRLWWKYLGIGVGIAAAVFLFLYYVGDGIEVGRVQTWSHRLHSWINPNPDELTQENMARMAVARGGLFGSGIGTTIHGRLMTQAHNDFIFSIIIEEAGTMAALAIFALYAWFYFRCIRIATACRGLFGSLSVAGIGTLIFIQAIINMAVAVGVFPVTGQTLPFISYGGSAYLFLGCGMGVIQAVAFDNKKQLRMNRAAQVSAPEDIAEKPVSERGENSTTNEVLTDKQQASYESNN